LNRPKPQNKKQKKQKQTANQPKRAYIVSLQNYPRSRLSLDGHLHTGHLKSARSAPLTQRLFGKQKIKIRTLAASSCFFDVLSMIFLIQIFYY
jgi:hypothetical protein